MSSIVDRSRSAAQEALGANVVSFRARKRLSQSALAERARVSRPTISRIERGDGDPTLRVLDSLAAALEVDVAELFAREGAEPLPGDAELDVRTRYSRAGRPRVA